MSLSEQLVLHACLDRFEEVACRSNYVGGGGGGGGGSSSASGRGSGAVRWRTPGSNAPNAMWMGMLIEVEERWNVYGYLTNTGIKFMLLVEDVRLNPADGTRDDDSATSFPSPAPPSSSSSSNNSNCGTINRESDLKKIFARLHELYVQHTMNPFSQLRSPIRSRRFDDGIVEMARSYNDVALERVTSSLEGEYGGGRMAKKDGLAWM
ncbi:hypothetical protein ACHAW5_008839 [Stephanodiscus triporus]|uniref:Trafficking protein particle complex subunit n=1 Tax=Stephanodiscus triporus TaxID=2934178 RepID=A0ABD3MDS9_9STRA